MKKFFGNPVFFILTTAVLLAGCQSAARHQSNLSSSNERNLTVGIIQKEIHVGMSQADVVQSLGSPNIVTKDKNDKETWVYDKIASEISYSNDSGRTWLILGTYSKNAGASSSTQKTLTVIVKFNPDRTVDSVSYHSSKF